MSISAFFLDPGDPPFTWCHGDAMLAKVGKISGARHRQRAANRHFDDLGLSSSAATQTRLSIVGLRAFEGVLWGHFKKGKFTYAKER